jgi:hypothetical protein
MRRTLQALTNSVGLICNAFLLFVVIISIYAVMAVNIFKVDDLDHPFISFSGAFYTLLGIAYGAHDWTVLARPPFRPPFSTLPSTPSLLRLVEMLSVHPSPTKFDSTSLLLLLLQPPSLRCRAFPPSEQGLIDVYKKPSSVRLRTANPDTAAAGGTRHQ